MCMANCFPEAIHSNVIRFIYDPTSLPFQSEEPLSKEERKCQVGAIKRLDERLRSVKRVKVPYSRAYKSCVVTCASEHFAQTKYAQLSLPYLLADRT